MDVFINHPKYRDNLIKYHYETLSKKHISLKKFIKWSDMLLGEIEKKKDIQQEEQSKMEEESIRKSFSSTLYDDRGPPKQQWRSAVLTSCRHCDIGECVNEDGVCFICGLQVSQGGTTSSLFGEYFF